MISRKSDLNKVKVLHNLTLKRIKDSDDEDIFQQWIDAIRDSEIPDLVALIGKLEDNLETNYPEAVQACREAVNSEVQMKLTENTISTMERLDTSASRLTKVSISVACVGGVVSLVMLATSWRQVVDLWEQISPLLNALWNQILGGP